MIKVVAAFLIHEKRVLIARRKAPGQLAGKWEFPGGKVENGETPEACLARELAEEFGIAVNVGAFITDSVHYRDKGAFHILAYQASWLSGRITPVDHDQYTWVGPDDLLGYDLLPADIELAADLIKKGLCSG